MRIRYRGRPKPSARASAVSSTLRAPSMSRVLRPLLAASSATAWEKSSSRSSRFASARPGSVVRSQKAWERSRAARAARRNSGVCSSHSACRGSDRCGRTRCGSRRKPLGDDDATRSERAQVLDQQVEAFPLEPGEALVHRRRVSQHPSFIHAHGPEAVEPGCRRCGQPGGVDADRGVAAVGGKSEPLGQSTRHGRLPRAGAPPIHSTWSNGVPGRVSITERSRSARRRRVTAVFAVGHRR